MISRAINISKQLHGWIESLKNTDIKGVKFLTNKEKERIAKDKEFAEYDKEMDRFKQELHDELVRREREGKRFEI